MKNSLKVVVAVVLLAFVVVGLFVCVPIVNGDDEGNAWCRVPVDDDMLGSHEVLSDYIEFTVVDEGVSRVVFIDLGDNEEVEAKVNENGNLYFGTMSDGVLRVYFDNGDSVDVLYNRVRSHDDGIAVPSHLGEYASFEYEAIGENVDMNVNASDR